MSLQSYSSSPLLYHESSSSSSFSLIPNYSLLQSPHGGEFPSTRHPSHVEPYFLSNKRGVFYQYEDPEDIEKYYPENYYNIKDKIDTENEENSSNEKGDSEENRRQSILSSPSSTSNAFITPGRVSLIVTLLLFPLGLGLFYYAFILNGPTPVVKARLNDFLEELTKLLNGLFFPYSSSRTF